MDKEEKRVEYLELIYDLIFVYIIGRNNSLLHASENGFVSVSVFLTYIVCSLAIIQIWSFSTFYMNVHGRSSARDHIFLFINMYLLYYMGEGTRLHWESFQNQYHLAWALILCNIGVQYVIERRNHPEDPVALQTANRLIFILFGEAAIVLVSVPVFNTTGIVLSPAAILFGIILTRILSNNTAAGRIDFPHLSERAMLFVVFTFGEMIIALAVYFKGGASGRSVYFSLLSFLIVAGLFLCYELLYNRIVDRETQTNGADYMQFHVFLIFAMNCITAALEFMQDDTVRLLPKMLMMILSLLMFVAFFFAIEKYAKPQYRLCRRLLVPVLAATAAFVILMIVLREQMAVNIAVTVCYVYGIFFIMLWFVKTAETGHSLCS